MQAIQIEKDVRKVLATGRAEGDRFYFPEGPPLERGLYERVNKTLKLIGGGKWKGGRVGAHVFDRDAEDLVEAAILTGSFVNEKKEFQFFETPRPVAERMIELAELRPRQMILEPSAGKGAIARVIIERMPEGCSLLVCEKNQFMLALLAKEGYHLVGFPSYDFLQYHPTGAQHVFDRIIQNPPFSKRQDALHALHAYTCLPSGGRLVTAMNSGILFRKDAEYEQVRSLAGYTEELPRGTFRESGTDISVVLVVIDKP